MSHIATVYYILIASPGDVQNERQVSYEVINKWNALNVRDSKIVLLPVMWETHSTPEIGARPQEIINKQLVEYCDILIGIFWTRIGSHTGIAESGTVEEIEQFITSGRPVLLYFSSKPVSPEKIDDKQYKKLKEFRAKCKKQGLVETYDSEKMLYDKIFSHLIQLTQKIRKEIPNNQSQQTYISPDKVKDLWDTLKNIRNFLRVDLIEIFEQGGEIIPMSDDRFMVLLRAYDNIINLKLELPNDIITKSEKVLLDVQDGINEIFTLVNEYSKKKRDKILDHEEDKALLEKFNNHYSKFVINYTIEMEEILQMLKKYNDI